MSDQSRRAVLAGGAGLIAALAGCTGPGGGGDGGGSPTDGTETSPGGGNGTDGGGTGTDGGTDQGTRRIRLVGRTSGWVGREPGRIQGKTNPTLRLQPGAKYELVWENGDGQEHELIVENGSGKQLAATESSSKKGETRSVTFTASEQMASYYCEYHPQQMRGTVAMGGTGDVGGNTSEGTQTTTATATTQDGGGGAY